MVFLCVELISGEMKTTLHSTLEPYIRLTISGLWRCRVGVESKETLHSANFLEISRMQSFSAECRVAAKIRGSLGIFRGSSEKIRGTFVPFSWEFLKNPWEFFFSPKRAAAIQGRPMSRQASFLGA